MPHQPQSPTADREFYVVHLYSAAPQQLWQAWTNPDHIKNWWGPEGFTNTIHTMEIKPEGLWEFVMHGPDGTNFNNRSVFKEIVEPSRIVFEHQSAPKFITTVTFEPQGDKTLLTWHMLFESAELREQVINVFKADVGLQQNIEKLERYLQTM